MLKEHVVLMQQVKVFIQQLSNPFGFLQAQVEMIHQDIHQREL